MLTLGHLTAGEPPLLRWAGDDDAPEDPGRVVDKIVRCGSDGRRSASVRPGRCWCSPAAAA